MASPSVSIRVPMTLFQRLFQPRVRVWLDWERLLREDVPIHLGVVDTLAEMSSWYLPWYLANGHPEVEFRHLGARPIRLLDLPRVLDRLAARRRGAVEALVDDITRAASPLQFPIPLYSLPGEGAIVLDGNHRLSACVLSAVPFSLISFTIAGPLDPRILPDLIHWAPPVGDTGPSGVP